MATEPLAPSGLDSFPEDLISPHEAAKIVHCHVATIWRWVHQGKIRAWKRGGSRYLLSKADLLEQLEPVSPVRPFKLRKLASAESPGHRRAMEQLRRDGFAV